MGNWIYINTDGQLTVDAVAEALRNAHYEVQTDRDGDTPCLIIRGAAAPKRLTFGNLVLDLDNVSADAPTCGQIHLTPIEFSMLRYLMQNARRAVSRDELLPAVWGFPNDSTTRVADDTVKRLRRKLEKTDVRIETVWGYGFKISQ